MLANAGKCRPPHIIRGCHSHDSIEAGSTLTRANCDHSPMRSTAICLIQSISHLEHQKRQSPFSLSLIDRHETSWRRFKSLHAQWREEEGRLSFTNSFSIKDCPKPHNKIWKAWEQRLENEPQRESTIQKGLRIGEGGTSGHLSEHSGREGLDRQRCSASRTAASKAERDPKRLRH